mgnify:CR=1 FL=1
MNDNVATSPQNPALAPPIASVILVAWNSAATLPRCLGALAAQSRPDFEVIVVDNASSGRPVQEILDGFPALSRRFVRLEENRGFAAANNLGARLARGEWLATLNPDAFPEPGWLAALLDAARRRPEFGFFASRLLQDGHPDRLDGEGDVYHASGLAWRRHYGSPAAPEPAEEEVFSACAAAALYGRAEFLSVGGFDESYFCYFEDVDLGFRLRLRGTRCLFVPGAVARHVGSAGTSRKSDFALFHGHRNLEWTFIKNMPARLFWTYLPLHLFTGTLMMLYYASRGRPTVLLKAKIAAWRGFKRAWRARRAVQAGRKVPVSEIRRVLDRRLGGAIRAALQRR